MPNVYLVEMTPCENGTLTHDLAILIALEESSEIDAIMHAFWTRNIPTNWIVTCVATDTDETQHNLSYHGALRISQRHAA